MPIEILFFDIGGTLGEWNQAAGKLIPYPGTTRLLRAVREEMGARIGIITTLGSLGNAQGRDILGQAGLAGFLDPTAFVSEHDVNGAGKPRPEIYRFAARSARASIGDCLYVGENLTEVIGAMTAGMRAILKPCPPGRELPV